MTPGSIKAELAHAALENPTLRRRLGETLRRPLSVPEARRLLMLATQHEALASLIYMGHLERVVRDMLTLTHDLQASMRGLSEALTAP